MDYLIRHNDTPIGTMIEPGADHPMGIVQGRFVPLAAYEGVRAVFRRLTEVRLAAHAEDSTGALKQAWEEIEALRLTVTTADGRLIPTTSVHVEDYVEELGDDGSEGIFVAPTDPIFRPEGNFFLDTRYWDGPGYWAEEDRASPQTPDP